MLFSEPKIPQFNPHPTPEFTSPSFSALQRAENSSINDRNLKSRKVSAVFQCSSASRKFLNWKNSRLSVRRNNKFQCSSASRKFLNRVVVFDQQRIDPPFQCSSASRKFLNVRKLGASRRTAIVSVLFSEPKIPQSETPQPAAPPGAVSVLFSEPKIPQFRRRQQYEMIDCGFSALQRAENSSMTSVAFLARINDPFQCSSASRKFLNMWYDPAATGCVTVSVLFSEPKIPQLYSII